MTSKCASLFHDFVTVVNGSVPFACGGNSLLLTILMILYHLCLKTIVQLTVLFKAYFEVYVPLFLLVSLQLSLLISTCIFAHLNAQSLIPKREDISTFLSTSSNLLILVLVKLGCIVLYMMS